ALRCRYRPCASIRQDSAIDRGQQFLDLLGAQMSDMAEYDETMSGNNCSCNSFNEFATGGVDLGGSATVTDTIIRGGIDVGGSGFVGTGHPWDGMEAVWPLDGSYDGTADEVLDVGPHSFHGFAGDGTGN